MTIDLKAGAKSDDSLSRLESLSDLVDNEHRIASRELDPASIVDAKLTSHNHITIDLCAEKPVFDEMIRQYYWSHSNADLIAIQKWATDSKFVNRVFDREFFLNSPVAGMLFEHEFEDAEIAINKFLNGITDEEKYF